MGELATFGCCWPTRPPRSRAFVTAFVCGLRPPDPRVHPHLLDPAAVLALAEPNPALSLRRVRALPAHLPALRAAHRAARPVADDRRHRPARRPARDRVAARSCVKEAPMALTPVEIRHVQLSRRPFGYTADRGRRAARGDRRQLRERLARPRRPRGQGRAARGRPRTAPGARDAAADDARLRRAVGPRAQGTGEAGGRADHRRGPLRGALDHAPGGGRARASRRRVKPRPRAHAGGARGARRSRAGTGARPRRSRLRRRLAAPTSGRAGSARVPVCTDRSTRTNEQPQPPEAASTPQGSPPEPVSFEGGHALDSPAVACRARCRARRHRRPTRRRVEGSRHGRTGARQGERCRAAPARRHARGAATRPLHRRRGDAA